MTDVKGNTGMANRQNGEVAMEIQGQTYTLLLDTNALVELEALFSTDKREMTFFEVLERVQKGSVRYMRGLIWAALRKYHKGISVEQTGDLIQQAGGLVAFNAELERLTQSAQPDPVDVEALGVTPSNGSGNPPVARVGRTRGSGGRSISTRAASV